MRTLVVYYSRTGTTERIARMLAAEFGADVERIRCPGCGPGWRGLRRTLLIALGRRAPPISSAAYDPSAYDLVIIGGPVWAWNISTPVRAYLRRESKNLPAIAVFATAGGVGFEGAFATMQTLARQKPLATLALTTEHFRKGTDRQAIAAFTARLRGAAPARAETSRRPCPPPP